MRSSLLITLIQPGMHGAEELAQHLNRMKSRKQISDWHPGTWDDRKSMVQLYIHFDSAKDALMAKMSLPHNCILK